MIDTLLSFVAPHSCCGCGVVGSELCEGCRYNIISEGFSVCVGCLRPTSRSNLCSSCTDFSAAGIWCVGSRQTELKSIIDAYKFESAQSAADTFAALFDAVIPILPEGVVVTPVPTAPAHVRERGFDHMALIAREFARRRGLVFRPLLLRKAGGTQHFMSKKQRLEAARSAFELTSAPMPEKVLLLDDILTTGATMRAALQLLDEAGTSERYGAIIARQPLDESAHLW